jgi:chaperonin cofactor prefoldin
MRKQAKKDAKSRVHDLEQAEQKAKARIHELEKSGQKDKDRIRELEEKLKLQEASSGSGKDQTK